jgi:hypothetical protein
MAKAAKRLPPATGPGNGEPPAERLSTNQAAAALVALLNGAQQVPTVGQLRSVVRRACRARLISAKGGRRHG